MVNYNLFIYLDDQNNFLPSVQLCADGYDVTNLVSADPAVRRRGFKLEYFLRPPVQVQVLCLHPSKYMTNRPHKIKCLICMTCLFSLPGDGEVWLPGGAMPGGCRAVALGHGPRTGLQEGGGQHLP